MNMHKAHPFIERQDYKIWHGGYRWEGREHGSGDMTGVEGILVGNIG